MRTRKRSTLKHTCCVTQATARTRIAPVLDKLLRRLWILKVYCDVIEDGGGKPLLADLLQKREVRDFRAISIGVLVQPTDISGCEAKVRNRFAFLANIWTTTRSGSRCSTRATSKTFALACAT